MEKFFEKAEYENHPLRRLLDFLEEEKANETAKRYDQMRFVGYVLEIGYDGVTIITSDPFKEAVGGVPRGSFLIMAPGDLDGLPPHFTLLRVDSTAPTPLSREVQQTYFELHKKSMPELDIWTQGELQWGALACTVLGMYYPDPNKPNKVAFSGDVNNIVSAHRYKVYAPNESLLDLIVNSMVRETNRFTIGKLRLTECQLPFSRKPLPTVDVQVSTDDFRGFRTAMFGKTRLGKSNVVKIIAHSQIETTKETRNVGQLIFDINGEYANDNPQDGSRSLRSGYPDRCEVYALTKRPNTPSKPLLLNFYEQPSSCIQILAAMLEQDRRDSQYIRSFASVRLAEIEDIRQMEPGDSVRAARRIQMYWAILHKAGYGADEQRMRNLGLRTVVAKDFDPGFTQDLRAKAYGQAVPASPKDLNSLVRELETINRFRRDNPNDSALTSNGKPLFDADDAALLDFLSPAAGSGPVAIRPYRKYHSPKAGDFVNEILDHLDRGQTVILDLGNADDHVRMYFSDMLSRAVFAHQEFKFTSDKLGDHYIQLYFEEAHNLFPRDSNDLTGVYARFAKEGAKFHIGMVYSTQSPSTINRELLAQTENFFVAHMSSQDEVSVLAKLQVAFEGIGGDILRTRTPGYLRIITFSHRFVVPIQANLFTVA